MRADLYARKSSRDAGRSVARQERQWRADCAEQALEPGRVFVDPDFSASRYAKRERPDYQALLEHIRAKNCEMVCLWETSRGSRQMGEWVNFLDECRRYSVMIRVFGDDAETYDPRKQRDREHLIKEGMANESEVEKTRSRSQVGVVDAASQGRPTGPMVDGYKRIYSAPTEDSKSASGHRRLEITQVVDEERAQIYRWAAEGLINGVPANTIARILNVWGVPTPSGESVWMGGALVARLLRPSMEGHRVHQGKITKRHAWPGILDAETAIRLRQVVRSGAPGVTTADTRLKHLLSGVIVCGRCGHQSVAAHRRKARGRVYHRYECEPARGGCGKLTGPQEQIDEIVSTMVVTRLRQPDVWRLFESSTDHTPLIEAQEALDVLVARRDELYAEAAKPGGPSMVLIAAAERELLPQIDRAKERVRKLQVPPVLQRYDPADLAAHWPRYPVGERRSVVLGLVELVLSPVGKGGMWSIRRLAGSRWRGDQATWGDVWGVSAGAAPVHVEADSQVAQ